MLDVSARAVVVDRPVIEQFVIRVKEIYLGCYGRSEFVRDHIARVDQHRKRVPLGRIRRDPLERFRIAVVRVYPDKADPLSFIGFGQLVDPVDICLYHRALCRQKDQDRAVLSAQAVKGVVLAVRRGQSEIIKSLADRKLVRLCKPGVSNKNHHRKQGDGSKDLSLHRINSFFVELSQFYQLRLKTPFSCSVYTPLTVKQFQSLRKNSWQPPLISPWQEKFHRI